MQEGSGGDKERKKKKEKRTWKRSEDGAPKAKGDQEHMQDTRELFQQTQAIQSQVAAAVQASAGSLSQAALALGLSMLSPSELMPFCTSGTTSGSSGTEGLGEDEVAMPDRKRRKTWEMCDWAEELELDEDLLLPASMAILSTPLLGPDGDDYMPPPWMLETGGCDESAVEEAPPLQYDAATAARAHDVAAESEAMEASCSGECKGKVGSVLCQAGILTASRPLLTTKEKEFLTDCQPLLTNQEKDTLNLQFAKATGTLPRPCATCRRNKVKCDYKFPCGRCRKAGIECKIPHTVALGRPPKSLAADQAAHKAAPPSPPTSPPDYSWLAAQLAHKLNAAR